MRKVEERAQESRLAPQARSLRRKIEFANFTRRQRLAPAFGALRGHRADHVASHVKAKDLPPPIQRHRAGRNEAGPHNMEAHTGLIAWVDPVSASQASNGRPKPLAVAKPAKLGALATECAAGTEDVAFGSWQAVQHLIRGPPVSVRFSHRTQTRSRPRNSKIALYQMSHGKIVAGICPFLT
ncbi:MAG: hypothetical protein OEN23_04845 [Paracoccaceae bacterium]|nr:hypothetical protein [Paracoccaceae bacterium]